MTSTQSPTGDGLVVSLITLGCKLNQADSDALAREFSAAGCHVVDRTANADIFVINTCSVTHIADRKSRKLVRLARRVAPDSTIVLTGCYAETGGPDLQETTGADFVIRNRDKQRLVRSIVSARGESQVNPNAPHWPVHAAAGHRTRAFIKIQEGCNDVCAFCIVPRTRGRENSIPIRTIVRQVQEAEEQGAQEVVLTGTQLGAYGRDCGDGLRPRDVIQAVLADTGVARIRFSSLQPQDIDTQLLRLWDDPRLCRHFHLALQSGSESILRRMRRRYTAAQFAEALSLIRTMVDDVAVTTDVIVAFPGESDAEFEESLAFARDAEFAGLHVFPYSRRSGTSADRMPGHVAPQTKQSRMERMLGVKHEAEAGFRSRFIGRTMAVLWETERDGVWEGLTDNYLRVFAGSPGLDRNHVTDVRITGTREDGLIGQLIDDSPALVGGGATHG